MDLLQRAGATALLENEFDTALRNVPSFLLRLQAAEVRAAVGLPESIRFYDLRHTERTMATRSGATLKNTMVRAGQSSEKVVLYQPSGSPASERRREWAGHDGPSRAAEAR